MRIETPNQIAAFIGSCVSIAILLLLLLLKFALDLEVQLWIWVAAGLVAYGVSFGVAWWAVDKFLFGKINALYRTIQSPEATEARMKDLSKKKDVLQEVQKDVEKWATVKQREIQSLKEQAKFRRDFIGNLAHEIKTPIFNMQGYLLTLLEGGLEDPKINMDYLTRADKNLERLIALVEDMDSISQLESGRENLKMKKRNLVEIIEEAFQLLEHRAEEKNIKLKFNKKYDRPITVKVDRDKIAQVFTNLIMNAIYYGKEGGFVEVRILDMPQHVVVELADNGIGVASEDLPRLFERFYRVDKSRSRNQGGTGLGLAIVKHIIESHGQTINVHSEVDRGTTFSFTLPKAK